MWASRRVARVGVGRVASTTRRWLNFGTVFDDVDANVPSKERIYQAKRLSNATCSQLYDTVLDVEAYPAYLPFCMSASVLQRVEHADGLELLADFQVGGV